MKDYKNYTFSFQEEKENLLYAVFSAILGGVAFTLFMLCAMIIMA